MVVSAVARAAHAAASASSGTTSSAAPTPPTCRCGASWRGARAARERRARYSTSARARAAWRSQLARARPSGDGARPRRRAARRAARARGGAATSRRVCADARTFELARRDFAAVPGADADVQLLGGAAGRVAFLRRARAHLRPGGLLACAIVTEVEPFDCAAGDLGPSAGDRARRTGATTSAAPRACTCAQTRRAHRARAPHLPRRRRARRRGASAQPRANATSIELDRVSAAQLEREGARGGPHAGGHARDRARPRSTSAAWW